MQLIVGQARDAHRSTVRFWDRTRSGARALLESANLRGVLLACLVGMVFGLLLLISPLLAVLLGMGLLIFITALSWPVVLCYLVIAATILTSGIERGRLFPVLTGNEITLLGAVGITFLLVLADKNRKIAVPRYYWIALCLLVGGTVLAPAATFLLQRVALTFDNAFKMFSSVQYFLLFWLFTVQTRNEGDRHRIILWMMGFGLLVAIIGLAQGAGFGPVNRLLENLYASSHESVAARAGRVTSLLGSWNSLGIFMMAVCFLSWALLSETQQFGQRLFALAVLGFSAVCLLASGSYAGLLGLLAGLGLIQILSKQRSRIVLVVIAGLIAAIPLLVLIYPYLQPLVAKRLSDQFQYGGMMPQTLAYRIQVWTQIFIPAIRAHFPWPVYPTVPTYYAWQFEESQYILLLFRTGLIGFLSYLAWIGVTIGWLYRRYRRSEGFDKAIASATLTLIIVLTIAGVTNEVFSFAGTIDYFWIMLALVANGREAT